MAYPSTEEGKQRQDFVDAAMAGSLKARGKHAPDYIRHWKRERILPKVNAGLKRIESRRIPSLWVLYKHLGVFKYWDDDLSVSAACDALTQFDGRADYDPQKSGDDFEAIWPNAGSQATPEKNARRNFYESVPALAMTIGLPIFQVPPSNSKNLFEMLKTQDWVLPACERANSAAQMLYGLSLFDGKRLNVPKHQL